MSQKLLDSATQGISFDPSGYVPNEYTRQYSPQNTGSFLFFDGEEIGLYNDKGSLQKKWPADSGQRGVAVPKADFPGSYTPEYQAKEGIGPLPEGLYELNPETIRYKRWYHDRKFPFFEKRNWGETSWGKARAPLNQLQVKHKNFPGVPERPGTFYIHGGNSRGSAGCIDLGGREDVVSPELDFFKEINHLNQRLDVEVGY